jgi:hypothetical protein
MRLPCLGPSFNSLTTASALSGSALAFSMQSSPHKSSGWAREGHFHRDARCAERAFGNGAAL